jgi:hypothetical protein
VQFTKTAIDAVFLVLHTGLALMIDTQDFLGQKAAQMPQPLHQSG